MYRLSSNFHSIDVPPLFIITLSFMIGIIYHTLLIPFFIVFALLMCCIPLFQQRALFKQAAICSFFICTGAWLHHKELRDYDNFYTLFENKKITITGTVIDKNEVIQQYKNITVFTLSTDTIATEYIMHKPNKIVLLYTKNNTIATVGDTITLHNACCKKPSNESFQYYQIKEQVVATIFDDTPRYTINNHPIWSLRHWIWSQKKRLLDSIANKISSNGFRFFSSLFLGNRACIKAELEETNEQFKTWGISHFLARSGLHLALFILIWQTVFCVIPLSLILKQFIIALLSCIYFILTWASAPFTRSFALFILNKLCLFTNTSFHLLHYLTLVCFCFLLYCPLYLFFLDFQLSFALTFALAWFNQLSSQYAIHQSKY